MIRVLPTDAFVFILLIAGAIFIRAARRRYYWHNAWQQVRRNGVAVFSLIMLSFYGGIALLDTIHYVDGESGVTLSLLLILVKDLKRIICQVKPDLIQAGPIQTSAFLVALTGFQPLITMSWGYDLLQDAHRNQLWRWATRYTLKHSTVMVGDCNTIRQKAVSYRDAQ